MSELSQLITDLSIPREEMAASLALRGVGVPPNEPREQCALRMYLYAQLEGHLRKLAVTHHQPAESVRLEQVEGQLRVDYVTKAGQKAQAILPAADLRAFTACANATVLAPNDCSLLYPSAAKAKIRALSNALRASRDRPGSFITR